MADKLIPEQHRILNSKADFLFISGGRQCLRFDQMIQTPSGPRSIEAIFNTPGSLVNTPFGVGVSYPGHSGDSKMIEITHSNGTIVCTPNHSILTARGWIPASSAIVGERLPLSILSRSQTNSDIDLSIRASDGFRCSQRVADLMDHYLPYCYQYDEPLHALSDVYLSSAPSLDDVEKHNGLLLGQGDSQPIHKYNHVCQQSSLPSKKDDYFHSNVEVGEHDIESPFLQHILKTPHKDHNDLQHDENCKHSHSDIVSLRSQVSFSPQRQEIESFQSYCQNRIFENVSVFDSSLFGLLFDNYTEVANVRVIDTDKFYDISVPGHDCYTLADGTVHHNSGKTHSLVLKAILTCIKKPNARVLFTTSSDVQARDVYDRITDHPVAKNMIGKNKRATPQKWLQFPNGSTVIIMVTAFPDTLKGPAYDLVICDEIQDSWSGEDFERVVPALTLARQGQTILSGQPRSIHHWFFKHYKNGIPKGVLDPYSKSIGLGCDGYETIIMPTDKGALFQGEKGKRRLDQIRNQRQSDLIWERDYLCYWMSDSSKLVFDPLDVERLFCDIIPRPYQKNHFYILSHDLGWSKDHGVIIVYDCSAKEIAYCHQFPTGMKPVDPNALTDQRREIVKIKNQYRATYVLDATGGGNPGKGQNTSNYAKDFLDAMPDGRPIYINQYVKEELIKDLKYMIEQCAFKIPKCYEKIKAELGVYERVCDADKITYSSPKGVGMHDDHVMALAYVFHAMKKGWVNSHQVSISQLINNVAGY